ncbi:hypothetical protein ABIB25_003312 [Nakamurella sp. UYEF19]|uniref:DEAD/DEAH box helicase family protein n=1 Tax=Nakamurella sp. UYEF19 TaxID=1756392 RepID=UPI003392D105
MPTPRRTKTARAKPSGSKAAGAKTGAKAAGTRTAQPRKARRPGPTPVEVPEDGRLWLLDVPFQTRPPGAVYDRARKVHVYSGPELLPELLPYRSQPFSWRRWLEDDLNGGPATLPDDLRPAPAMEPRPMQTEGAAAILAVARSEHGGTGARGMLLTDDVGTGKTLTAWLGILGVARDRGATNVLVLVDRPRQITVPHWVRTIRATGTEGLRVLICSPDELAHLLVRGRPRWRMDLVIADESHLYRNVETQRVQRFRRITRFADEHHKAPFVLNMTATPANHPAELTYLAPLLAQVHAEPTARWANFGERLAESGMPLVKNYGRWVWNERAAADPAEQSASTARLRGWLSEASPPLTLHRAAPWGPAPLDLMPVQLDLSEQAAYRTAWSAFQQAIADLAADRAVRSNPSAGVARGGAAVLRLRQKASMIRATTTAQWAVSTVAAGRQALISCEFLSAAAEPIADAVEASGVRVARLYGTAVSGKDLEAERLLFQRGLAPVVVFTPTTSLSLHAREMLGDGTFATDQPREGLMHNVRYSGLAGRQILGRSHRDGQVCPWWLAYAQNSVEETIAQIMIGRFKSANDTAGADSETLTAIAEALGVSWLPIDLLVGHGSDG